jgi:hypothetical protein
VVVIRHARNRRVVLVCQGDNTDHLLIEKSRGMRWAHIALHHAIYGHLPAQHAANQAL